MSRRPAEFALHPMPFPSPSRYRAVVRHVIDGDTFDCLVDLGFSSFQYLTVRVRNVDTPEVVGASRAAGLAAKARTEALCLGSAVALSTYATDRTTFGRWVADVTVWIDGQPQDLASVLRAEGHDVRGVAA